MIRQMGLSENSGDLIWGPYKTDSINSVVLGSLRFELSYPISDLCSMQACWKGGHTSSASAASQRELPSLNLCKDSESEGSQDRA